MQPRIEIVVWLMIARRSTRPKSIRDSQGSASADWRSLTNRVMMWKYWVGSEGGAERTQLRPPNKNECLARGLRNEVESCWEARKSAPS